MANNTFLLIKIGRKTIRLFTARLIKFGNAFYRVKFLDAKIIPNSY